MSISRIKEAYEAFGPVLKQMYGQTEVPNLITTLSKQAHERAIKNGNDVVLKSVGSPCLMTQIMIVDVENGNPLPIGQEGEILARSPYSMKEYHRRPKATARTFQEGWVRTGDVGRIDQNGKLTLLDRLDDIVISGGMNIYTVEVENAINSHPSVKNSCVVGIPDQEWGEIAVAIVVPKSKTLGPNELINHLETAISSYKKPKRFVFTQSLPKTKYGKIDKSTLRETIINV
jgi:fatty-acyl-CoA synthase/long-chain acyl-CoA synthetase